ncbi:MAG: ABC transporter permease [Rikenellaceae bacterium]|nr:ABC transporter permease [Rikenellaceae bacterium]
MSKVGLIVSREWNERVRKKSFIVTTLLTPLLMVGMIALVAWLTSRGASGVKNIVVIDHSGFVVEKLENHPKIVYHPASEDMDAEALKRNRQDDTWGVLIVGANILQNSSDVELYSFESSTIEVESIVANDIERIVEERKLDAYEIADVHRILDEIETEIQIRAFTIDEEGAQSSTSSILSYAVSYVFGFLMYMFVLIYGSQVMMGVIEEKNNKVLEVMVSSVRPMELMMGKIFGVAAVAVTQFSLWVIIAVGLGKVALDMFVPDDVMASAASISADPVAMAQTTSEMTRVLSVITTPGYVLSLVGGFLVFFVGGYLLYAAMFAAVGSAVDNASDSAQFQNVVTIPIIVALVVMFGAMSDPDGALAVWFSMIPFTSPIVMMARLPYGVPFWEVALSIVLLYATFVVMVWLAGKIYRVGILMHGKKPTFKELYKWMTYKY